VRDNRARRRDAALGPHDVSGRHARHSAFRLDQRCGAIDAQGRRSGADLRERPHRAVRLQSAASRTDARNVPDGLRGAVLEMIGVALLLGALNAGPPSAANGAAEGGPTYAPQIDKAFAAAVEKAHVPGAVIGIVI